MKKILIMMLCVTFCLSAVASVSAAIPTVSEDDKVDIMVIAREDFDDLTTATMNRNGSPSAVNAAGGFASLDNLDSSIEDGALKVNLSKAFFDFQYQNVDSFPKVSEDAIFSMKVMPLSDNFGTSNLLVWGTNGNFEEVHSKIVERKLIVDGQEKAELPLNEYSLLEWAFHYDASAKQFSTVDVLLNGKIVASYALNSDATVARVDHIRLFQDFNGQFAVDDFVLAKGTTSLAYYSPNGKVPEVNNNPEDNQKPDNTVTTTPVEETTTAA